MLRSARRPLDEPGTVAFDSALYRRGRWGVFQDIREKLDEVVSNPFILQLDGVGFFPSQGKPRVVWVGLRQSKELVHSEFGFTLFKDFLFCQSVLFSPFLPFFPSQYLQVNILVCLIHDFNAQQGFQDIFHGQ